MPDLAATYLERLLSAVNEHDLDALASCFTEGYRNETPVHPGRGFVGRAQVRANWVQIFAGVPDLHATVLRSHADETTVWSEWELTGTRVDRSAFLLRGVVLFGVEEQRAAWARFYLEPVDEEATTVADAVRAQVHADTSA